MEEKVSKKTKSERVDHATFAVNMDVAHLAEAHTSLDVDLRPKNFDDYPGQEQVVENLKVYTEAAKLRGKMLDHCLFHGPPGLGKTTLAGIIANIMGCTLKVTSGPVVERAADLMGILASLEPNTILFIDEIHRLSAAVEEILYTALEDRRIDIVIGHGAGARTVNFDLPPFTLIGATTKAGSLSSPLRARFGIVSHLNYYTPETLAKIVVRSADLMKAKISPEAAIELARRSRGTPRVANTLLRRVLDFAIVAGKEEIDVEIVDIALKKQGIDELGLSDMDREMLVIMRDRYEGGPVGLDSLAAALNQERSTLEDVYEPYLVYKGYITRTPRGRSLTSIAWKHIGGNAPQSSTLFEQ